MIFETVRFTLTAKNKYSTKRGQQVGFGNHGWSNDGIRSYLKKRKELEEESKEERLRLVTAWDMHAKANGIDIEWKRKINKEVRIRWQCEVSHSIAFQRI